LIGFSDLSFRPPNEYYPESVMLRKNVEYFMTWFSWWFVHTISWVSGPVIRSRNLIVCCYKKHI